MNINNIRIQVLAALEFSTLRYENYIRASFEVWAMVQAGKLQLRLELVTRSQSVWQWYKAEFDIQEQLFYEENIDYINKLSAPREFYDLFEMYVQSIEYVYPKVLLKPYQYEDDNA